MRGGRAVFPEQEEIEKVEGEAPKRTQIGAEEPPGGKGRPDQYEGPQDAADDLPEGDDGIEAEERVDPEVDVRREASRAAGRWPAQTGP